MSIMIVTLYHHKNDPSLDIYIYIISYDYNYNILVGGWAQPLWKYDFVSWEYCSQYGKIEAMFQTTNQITIQLFNIANWKITIVNR